MTSKTTGNTGFSASVKEFVESYGGNHEIKKVLVANNGIGAVKAIRSIRKWAFETFGDETAIQFVVMATPEDMRANAEFVRLADEVVDVPGGTNNNNYANVNLICEVAERCEVDAVMPMWGHASENPNLPNSLLKCKRRITFVGPPAEPMQALGDKIGSTIIAQSAGVPTIAWNGDGLTVDYQKDGISEEMYNEANVQTPEQALSSCCRIGFPVMIKASEGGGGKGIRSVHREEDVVTLFRQVQGEVPGSPIFVMKMASGARHLEVQLLADQYGEAIALSGRDCSVQRRHQKIVEEGPPVAADPAVFRQMERSAVALAKTVGYCSAGTVEFLYVDATQTYSFLELNPRLQVEHPVTENILGINLPACQLQVAMGLPLHRIRDIRRLYGRHPQGNDTIDFEYAERCAPPKHCIAVRITAENPDAGFQPTSGKFKELQFRPAVDVWGYFSVNSSGLIHEYADSQFGHVFASGPDRESARRAMIVSLKELDIRGDISTTTQYIINMMQTEDYVHNRIDTAWLDKRIARHAELKMENLSSDPHHTLVVACGAALMSFKHFDERQTRFRHLLSVGQVPGKDTLSQSVGIDLIYKNIKYTMLCILGGPSSVIVECGGASEDITIRKQSDGGHLLAARGKSHVIYSQDLGEGAGTRIILDGFTCNFTPEYDPTRLTSTVAGKLARLLVADGSHVTAGAPYVEIEVMKMYMPLKAAESGIVKFQMSEGASLSPGDLIAVMDLDDPERVVKAEEFHGSLIATKTDKETSGHFPHVIARESLKTIDKIFEGYYFKEEAAANALTAYLRGLTDPALPSYEMEEALSVVRGRIPAPLYSAISKLNEKFREKVLEADKLLGTGSGTGGGLGSSNGDRSVSFHVPYLEYPADSILQHLHQYLESVGPAGTSAVTAATKLTETLWNIAETYLYPSSIRTLVRMLKLTETYLDVEQLFDSQSFQDVVQTLRLSHPGDWDKVSTLCMSHVNLPLKNFLMLKVIEVMMVSQVPAVKFRPKMPKGIPLRLEMNIRNLKVRLTELSKLREGVYSRLSFAANLCLMDQQTMSYEKRHDKLQDTIVEALTTGDEAGHGERVTCLTRFVESGIAIKDLFFESLAQDRDYVIAFMELYLRRVYQKTHNLQNMTTGYHLPDDAGRHSPFIQFDFLTRAVEALPHFESSGTSADVSSPATSAYTMSYSDLAAITHLVKENAGLMDSDLEGSSTTATPSPALIARSGLFVVVETCADMERLFPSMLQQTNIGNGPVTPLKKAPKNVLDIVVIKSPPNLSEDEVSNYFTNYLSMHEDDLCACGIRRVTYICGSAPEQEILLTPSASAPAYGLNGTVGNIFTYRARTHFHEDHLFRHIESAYAFHLDLMRLDNFDISLVNGLQTSSGNVQLYMAIEKGFQHTAVSAKLAATAGRLPVRRYYARLVSFTSDIHSSDAESLFVEALDTLALAIGHEEHSSQLRKYFNKGSSSVGNHIFLNVVAPDVVIQPDFFENELKRFCTKYSQKMQRLFVATVEFKLTCRLMPTADPLFIRLVASNPTGYVLKVESYYETIEDKVVVFRGINQKKGEWEGKPISTPYPVSKPFDAQRGLALASSETLFVYDWPVLFQKAAADMWEAYSRENTMGVSTSASPLRSPGLTSSSTASAIPDKMISCEELVLCELGDDGEYTPLSAGWTADGSRESAVLRPFARPIGKNDVGMVAWIVTLKTPEYPTGRQFVIVANDITFSAGSFGTKEDLMFYKVSEYCRHRGVPRLYLAANSGARIGMAQSLKAKFQVCWTDSNDPSRGFKYIYLSADDYEEMLVKAEEDVNALPVICKEVTDPESGEYRYVITDIIGEEDDLGVENLMGSGLIAGETSKAYDDIFTLTLVVGRTVGIGAYLVRLGQRTIQKVRSSPIILTGYQALNKLMGRDIYTSNDQLGGPMIMYPNGVSHLLADTHLDCISKALEWLSFVPSVKGAQLPRRQLAAMDHAERPVSFCPQKGVSYDPRHMLAGHMVQLPSGEERWVSGFFDRSSFVETLGGWAKTVVVGRARLGGLPLGVIVTENRTAEAMKPADPADPTSQETMVQQAGGVWFPDSAYKTAQALRDFNREDLPCMIFANWRGFSGGQRDMFDEVLKFGSMIVDALVAYEQPLFVYIPPFSELRGGAWVVVDSTINADCMEFYAAEDARGGVLEATGAVAIKFREKDLKLAAHRLDPELISLDARLDQLKSAGASADAAEIAETTRLIVHRERMLLGVYQQVAVHFGDLHDTPGRMKRKGVIRRQVNWVESRAYFFWRLQRRLAEFDLAKKISKMNASPSSAAAAASEQGKKKPLPNLAAAALLKEWYLDSGAGTEEQWDGDDRMAVKWLNDNTTVVAAKLTEVRKAAAVDSMAANFMEMLKLAVECKEEGGSTVADVMRAAMAKLGQDEQKADVLAGIKELL